MLFNLYKLRHIVYSLNVVKEIKYGKWSEILLINISAEDLKNPFDNLHRKLCISVP